MLEMAVFDAPGLKKPASHQWLISLLSETETSIGISGRAAYNLTERPNVYDAISVKEQAKFFWEFQNTGAVKNSRKRY